MISGEGRLGRVVLPIHSLESSHASHAKPSVGWRRERVRERSDPPSSDLVRPLFRISPVSPLESPSPSAPKYRILFPPARPSTILDWRALAWLRVRSASVRTYITSRRRLPGFTFGTQRALIHPHLFARATAWPGLAWPSSHNPRRLSFTSVPVSSLGRAPPFVWSDILRAQLTQQ